MISESTRRQYQAASERQAVALIALHQAKKELEASWRDFYEAAQQIESDATAARMGNGRKP